MTKLQKLEAAARKYAETEALERRANGRLDWNDSAAADWQQAFDELTTARSLLFIACRDMLR